MKQYRKFVGVEPVLTVEPEEPGVGGGGGRRGGRKGGLATRIGVGLVTTYHATVNQRLPAGGRKCRWMLASPQETQKEEKVSRRRA
jgi:hypothetical protein